MAKKKEVITEKTVKNDKVVEKNSKKRKKEKVLFKLF